MKALHALEKPELAALIVAAAVCTFVLVGIFVSGTGMHGDLLGVSRATWFILNAVTWAVAFGIIMVVSMVTQKHRYLLSVTLVLMGARMVSLWWSVTCGRDASAHAFLWFPLEGFVYLIWKYPISMAGRLVFTVINLVLYAVQLAIVARFFTSF